MSVKLRSYQLVFLVDVSIGIRSSESESNFECLLNKTRLSALKVLTFLEDTLPHNHKASNLKWGFKFFNFGTFNSSIERYEFKDFSIRTFEQFESLLENKSVAQRTKVKEENRNNEVGNSSGLLSSLSNALKEVVTDYQWDFPDITSPVRPVRHRKGAKAPTSGEPNQHNFVFVLGPCPGSLDQWNKYAFRNNEDEMLSAKADLVRQAILPPLVSRIFCDQKKIQLFWIDTADMNAPCDPSVSKVVMV